VPPCEPHRPNEPRGRAHHHQVPRGRQSPISANQHLHREDRDRRFLNDIACPTPTAPVSTRPRSGMRPAAWSSSTAAASISPFVLIIVCSKSIGARRRCGGSEYRTLGRCKSVSPPIFVSRCGIWTFVLRPNPDGSAAHPISPLFPFRHQCGALRRIGTVLTGPLSVRLRTSRDRLADMSRQ
jgi:hypothetical protein